MKSLFKTFFFTVTALFMMQAQAAARGEFPPPPPFTGGNIGDWLGSGPIFGFEPPRPGHPWTGGGYGSGGGANGGWGGAWWQGNGPLGGDGGGAWGGWGGWGHGIGPKSGGIEIGTDTSRKGHVWPDEQDSPFNTCFVETLMGGYSQCRCWFTPPPGAQPGKVVPGICGYGGYQGGDPRMLCDFTGVQCFGTID